MRLTCNQEKSVRIWYEAQKKTFFDILKAINCPVDELAKSPHFECGVWRFESSRGNNWKFNSAGAGPSLEN